MLTELLDVCIREATEQPRENKQIKINRANFFIKIDSVDYFNHKSDLIKSTDVI
jgi:hypothetical protein